MLTAGGAIVTGLMAASVPAQTGTPMTPPDTASATAPVPGLYTPVSFAELPGWAKDDQAAAWVAFRASCAAGGAALHRTPLHAVCAAALQQPATLDRAKARAFFEQHFVPNRVTGDNAPGLLTAYYEPVVAGRRTPQPGFTVPLHRRPADLVNLVDEADRAVAPGTLTHARIEKGKPVPYATRQQIDEGALVGKGLEMFYVADAVERFFLQVQGSGIIALQDGQQVRIGYDGKNGHPYTSVGRSMIDSGVMGADQMSLETMAQWLRADPARGERAIWQNKSYVFFREMPEASAPIGVMGVALTPHRSLAIDPAFHQLGLPVYLDAPTIKHITGKPFRQLMVGQDVGSAIRGRQRGDIYAGSGPTAGKIAGITKHPGHFFVLLPEIAGAPR